MKNISLFLLFIIFLSCDKKKQDNTPKQDTKPLLSVVKEYRVAKKVNAIFLKDVEDWQELKAVDNFLSRFKKVSPNEVLSNALELKDLVRSLKDSVKPELFDVTSFKVRINILHNETLRLADMTFIPAIKAEEISVQTEKIMNAFSAVNSKVNTILQKKRFEDAIEVGGFFIGLDSTKIDSVSKNSIKKNFDDILLEKEKSKLDLSKNPKRNKVLKSKKKQ